MAVITYLICALVAAAFVVSRRFAWWRRTVPYRYPRILMYHMISEHRAGAKFNKLRVPPRCFEEQLRWLQRSGWHFALMSELLGDDALPEKSVILTFDDGYADNLIEADPIMQRYGARATLYLVEDRFDRDWSTSKKAHHDSGELMREPKLSDEQVEAMLASGRWELGGHTRTHANLARLDDAARREEIAGARRSLGERFAQAMSSFAYPFGIYAPVDVAAAREAGFASAVTTVEGISRDPRADAFELPRVKVGGKDSLRAFRLRMRTGRRSA
ncbi:MAG: polysaccharide deacetylase family protein [Halieaceae bacterium]|jgi:peptidoglycan/xylan/chitin deacetylase (PgdA/CDA1 family)|nr:polysaccharide deacetylase family protein [Halieaceae bacterium]